MLVHIHDIFTPKDYPEEWIKTSVKFFNEQYLMEAFLSMNAGFKIICALNHLQTNYSAELSEKFPILKGEMNSQWTSSFWITRK